MPTLEAKMERLVPQVENLIKQYGVMLLLLVIWKRITIMSDEAESHGVRK